jgi:hypothetical protein
MIRGEIEERPLPGGATALVSREFPVLPEAQQRAAAAVVARSLAG